MYRPRVKLITPLTSVIIDPISHLQSDIDEDSLPLQQIHMATQQPSSLSHPSALLSNPSHHPSSLLSSINLKNRVESSPQLLFKQQTIYLSSDESNSSSHNNPYNQIHQFQQEVSESGSVVFLRKKTNPQCLKKKLRRQALGPKVSNKVKLQKKDQNTVQCSICLSDLKNNNDTQVGRLNCGHLFCYACIKESSTFSTKCPYCRSPYRQILRGNKVVRVHQVIANEQMQEPMDEPCYVCGRNDDFQKLLQCQYCQYAYCHTYCDQRLTSDQPPNGSWFCRDCQRLIGNQQAEASSAHYDQVYQQSS